MDPAVLRDDMVDSLEHEAKRCVRSEAVSVAMRSVAREEFGAGERNVQAIDIARRLVLDARGNLASAGYEGVLVDRRNGSDGLPEYAPYDRILLEAAAIDPPRALLDQLAPDGRLVLPAGGSEQTLVAVEHRDGEPTVADRFGTVAFAPMLVESERADTVEHNRTQREDREHARRAAERRRGWERDWIDWDGDAR